MVCESRFESSGLLILARSPCEAPVALVQTPTTRLPSIFYNLSISKIIPEPKQDMIIVATTIG